MMMLPCAFWPLAEHAEFGQNCFDASIGSVHVCICYSMPMDACFFNHSFPFHRIVGFYPTWKEYRASEFTRKSRKGEKEAILCENRKIINILRKREMAEMYLTIC